MNRNEAESEGWIDGAEVLPLDLVAEGDRRGDQPLPFELRPGRGAHELHRSGLRERPNGLAVHILPDEHVAAVPEQLR